MKTYEDIAREFFELLPYDQIPQTGTLARGICDAAIHLITTQQQQIEDLQEYIGNLSNLKTGRSFHEKLYGIPSPSGPDTDSMGKQIARDMNHGIDNDCFQDAMSYGHTGVEYELGTILVDKYGQSRKVVGIDRSESLYLLNAGTDTEPSTNWWTKEMISHELTPKSKEPTAKTVHDYRICKACNVKGEFQETPNGYGYFCKQHGELKESVTITVPIQPLSGDVSIHRGPSLSAPFPPNFSVGGSGSGGSSGSSKGSSGQILTGQPGQLPQWTSISSAPIKIIVGQDEGGD